jgi:hypothetical protein
VQDVGSESKKVQTSSMLSNNVKNSPTLDQACTHDVDADIDIERVIFPPASRAVQEEGIVTISTPSIPDGSLALRMVTASSSLTAALRYEEGVRMDGSIGDLGPDVRPESCSTA